MFSEMSTLYLSPTKVSYIILPFLIIYLTSHLKIKESSKISGTNAASPSVESIAAALESDVGDWDDEYEVYQNYISAGDCGNYDPKIKENKAIHRNNEVCDIRNTVVTKSNDMIMKTKRVDDEINPIKNLEKSFNELHHLNFMDSALNKSDSKKSADSKASHDKKRKISHKISSQSKKAFTVEREKRKESDMLRELFDSRPISDEEKKLIYQAYILGLNMTGIAKRGVTNNLKAKDNHKLSANTQSSANRSNGAISELEVPSLHWDFHFSKNKPFSGDLTYDFFNIGIQFDILRAGECEPPFLI